MNNTPAHILPPKTRRARKLPPIPADAPVPSATDPVNVNVDDVLTELGEIGAEGPPEVRLFVAALEEVLDLAPEEATAAMVRAIGVWAAKLP
jgi:hypothetical protein